MANTSCGEGGKGGRGELLSSVALCHRLGTPFSILLECTHSRIIRVWDMRINRVGDVGVNRVGDVGVNRVWDVGVNRV